MSNRAVDALKRPHNWVQLAKFCAVGGSGYAINLVIYALLLGLGAHTAAAIALALASAAHAGTTTAPNPVYDANGHLVGGPFAAPPAKPKLTKDGVTRIFLADPQVHDWLGRYPPKPVTDATFANGVWTVN